MSVNQTTREENSSSLLARFLSELRYESLPTEVVARTEEAFVDWFGCTLAGKNAPPVKILENFAATMGPLEGPSQILVSRRQTSPFFAALVNGAASHIAELDDVHNGAGFHPGTAVFPAVFAAAQQAKSSGREFITAAVAGYEAAVRAGEFLGPEHYKIFHTTGTAGTIGAAAGVGSILGLNPQTMLHAFGSAGTQAAGLWEFLRDAADSKPLHAGKAAADGLLAAYIARDGFTGASRILEGKKGMAAGMAAGNVDPAPLTEGLGKRWTILECTYKPYACCRHTHPAADALSLLMRENHLKADDIASVTAYVHQRALGVLGTVPEAQPIQQAKFSMGFVLALMAIRGKAGINDFNEASLGDAKIRAFEKKVKMIGDSSIPGTARVRPGRVEVTTVDGRDLEGRVAAAKGDPSNSLDRTELAAKANELAAFTGGAAPNEMSQFIAAAWSIHNAPDLHQLFLKN